MDHTVRRTHYAYTKIVDSHKYVKNPSSKYMHEYLISFTRVDYIKNLRAKFTHSNYARIAGVIVLEN
jgi:hypothetical protein